MQLHGIFDAEGCTMLVEDSVELGISPSAEGVGEDIEVGGNPLGLPLEVTADLGG